MNSVSLVFHFALQIAGMTAQTAPAAMLAIIIMIIRRVLGILFPNRIIHDAVARDPISTWPSPPIFQKRILNAGVTAIDTQSRIAIF